MPFRRRYGRRRVRRFRRRGARGGMPRLSNLQRALWMAKLAWRGVRAIRGLVNAEKHFTDTSFSTAISNSGAITHLSAVAQGDTNATRTGNSIFSRMIFAQGVFTLNTSADEDTVRVIVFSDKQQIGDTTPAVTDVLTSASINSPLNVTTLGRFQILKEFRRTFTSAGVNRGTYKFAIPMRHHVRYNGTASSDVQKGGLFVLLIASQPTNTLGHSAEWRLTFYDN